MRKVDRNRTSPILVSGQSKCCLTPALAPLLWISNLSHPSTPSYETRTAPTPAPTPLSLSHQSATPKIPPHLLLFEDLTSSRRGHTWSIINVHMGSEKSSLCCWDREGTAVSAPSEPTTPSSPSVTATDLAADVLRQMRKLHTRHLRTSTQRRSWIGERDKTDKTRREPPLTR
jgi:hypothetical protein